MLHILSYIFQSISSLPDRDGTIDLLITTCTSVSASTGLGTGCALNIAYNKQIPLCASASSAIISTAPVNSSADGKDAKRTCRRPDELCTADPQFKFEFTVPVSNVRLVISTCAYICILSTTCLFLYPRCSTHSPLPRPSSFSIQHSPLLYPCSHAWAMRTSMVSLIYCLSQARVLTGRAGHD